jgi:myo-inositol 2-dehydrogenase/D-chiro-inositol 1-dehydrogenase
MTRLAVAGAGWAGEVHAAAAAQVPNARLSQILSRTNDSAERVAAQTGSVGVTYRELSSKVEAVVVATTPDHHAEMASEAVRRGMAVLIEKPLCDTLDQADALIDLVEASPVPAGYAENLLFAPVVDLALAHRGGEPLSRLSIRTVQPAPDWGHFLEPLTDGGVLFDLGPHAIALALAFAGSDPVGVSADLSSTRSDGADDEAHLRLAFTDGLVAEVEISWKAESPSWDLEAAGSNTVIRMDMLPLMTVELNGEPATPMATTPLEDFGYVPQLAGLIDVVGGRGGRLCPLGFGRLVLEVIYAGYQSAGQSGAQIPLPYQGPRTVTPLTLWKP